MEGDNDGSGVELGDWARSRLDSGGPHSLEATAVIGRTLPIPSALMTVDLPMAGSDATSPTVTFAAPLFPLGGAIATRLGLR